MPFISIFRYKGNEEASNVPFISIFRFKGNEEAFNVTFISIFRYKGIDGTATGSLFTKIAINLSISLYIIHGSLFVITV